MILSFFLTAIDLKGLLHGGASEVEDAGQVDVEHRLPLGVAHFPERRPAGGGLPVQDLLRLRMHRYAHRLTSET